MASTCKRVMSPCHNRKRSSIRHGMISDKATIPLSASCRCSSLSCAFIRSSLTGCGGRTFSNARIILCRSGKESGICQSAYSGRSSSNVRRTDRIFSLLSIVVMLLQRWVRRQVVIIETFGDQAEIDQICVCLVKSRQHRVGNIYLPCGRVVHVEHGLPCNTDEYVLLYGKYFNIRILL